MCDESNSITSLHVDRSYKRGFHAGEITERERIRGEVGRSVIRYDRVGEYDLHIEPVYDGDYVKLDDVLRAIGEKP